MSTRHLLQAPTLVEGTILLLSREDKLALLSAQRTENAASRATGLHVGSKLTVDALRSLILEVTLEAAGGEDQHKKSSERD